MTEAPTRFIRLRLKRRLAQLLAKAVALKCPYTSNSPFKPLPDQAAFAKYTSRIPQLDKQERSKSWYQFIEPDMMADAWKQAFYTPNFVPMQPMPYHAAPQLPDGEDAIQLLKRLPNGRAPGPDGINSDLYKYLPDIFAPHLCTYWRALANLRLPQVSPLQSNIVMLYKKGDPKDPANYRPISLLDTDLKILTASLQRHSQQHFDKWFGSEQQGFLPGRWIHWNVRFLLDLLYGIRQPRFRSATNIKRQGLVLLKLDFRKAFDSVRWDYLRQVLATISPDSPELQVILESIYKPHSATILGDPSREGANIPINNGVKQGDCASPILFNLALEEFLKQLRQSEVRGLRKAQLDIKALAYADDTLLLCELRSLTRLLEILQQWSNASGVQVNYQKSNALIIPADPSPAGGPTPHRARLELDDRGIPHQTWSIDEDTDLGLYLGIPINTNPVVSRDQLESKLLAQMELAKVRATRARDYQSSDVRLRSRVATAMISSVPIYYLAAFNPSKAFLSKWKTLVSEYIYGKRHMRPSDLCSSLPVGNGGIKFWHPSYISKAMALYAIHKFLDPSTPPWALMPSRYMLSHKCLTPLWWKHAFTSATSIGILPTGTPFNSRNFTLLKQALATESHDSLFEKATEWWYHICWKKPPLIRYFPMRPRALREWWRVPVPARVRDWGWLTLWGKNHGGANSLRHPERCRACHTPTRDWWHWAKTCVVHQAVMTTFITFPNCEHWEGLSVLFLWANALGRLGSDLSVDMKHVIRVSYLAYLCWWSFHHLTEAPQEELALRRAKLSRELPKLLKKLYHGNYQSILDWTQEQTPLLYGQGTLPAQRNVED